MAGPAGASKGKVLILAGTVSGGAASVEASEATAQGYDVELADDSTWRAKSVTDFGGYRALILGDPDCDRIGTTGVQAAIDTVARWGAAVNGNVFVLGTDPTFHAGQPGHPGAEQLMRQAIDFALAQDGATGAFVSLSCYFHDASPKTKVPLLDAFSPNGFTVTGVGCFDTAHLVAVHPALAGLSDASLSNWDCSVHEAFDTFPGDFTPVAIAEGYSSTFTASDGSRGPPYILARGSQAFPLSLTPATVELEQGLQQHLTATIVSIYGPLANLKIGARVTAGPNVNLDLPCVQPLCKTNSAGQVEFEYYGHNGVGDDTVLAWIDLNGNGEPDPGEPQTTALVRWVTPYVAMGDSTTTGWSIQDCVSDMKHSPWKCLDDASHQRPAPPHPELIADEKNLRPLQRVGIWGSTLNQMIESFKRDHDVDDDDASKPEVPWIPQLKAARFARKLVTVSIGINDLNFSDVWGWGTAFLEGGALKKADDLLVTMQPDFDVLFDTLEGVQSKGAQIVIVLYYNPYGQELSLPGPLPTLERCPLLHGVADAVGNKLNDELSRRAKAKGFSVADLRPAFDGHGAGSFDPWVFGTQCDGGAAAGLAPGLPLPWGVGDKAKRAIDILYDPHPNIKGTRAQADTVEKVLR